jgi:hypothetical protein
MFTGVICLPAKTKGANNKAKNDSLERLENRIHLMSDAFANKPFEKVQGSAAVKCTLCLVPNEDAVDAKTYSEALEVATISWHKNNMAYNKKRHLAKWHWEDACCLMVETQMNAPNSTLTSYFGATTVPVGIKLKDYVNYLLALAIVSSETSFRTADNQWLKESYAVLSHKGVSTRTLFRSIYPKLEMGIMKFLAKQISLSEELAMSFDGWSSTMNRFIGWIMTCLVKSEAGIIERKDYALRMEVFDQAHSALNMKKSAEEILGSWGLTVGHISAFTTPIPPVI